MRVNQLGSTARSTMMQTKRIAVSLATTALLLAACGQATEEREVMKPEDTFAGDLVTAPTKVEDSINAAQAGRMQALDEGLSKAEGEGEQP